jgi:hypothetical protein
VPQLDPAFRRLQRRQLDVDRLVAPQAMEQRNQDTMQDRILFAKEFSGARRLRVAEHSGTSTDRRAGRLASRRGRAISTMGLFLIRLSFQAVSKVRTKARSPSTTMFTGVPTGAPSRR